MTDNPHYMTPEEAEIKFCPYTLSKRSEVSRHFTCGGPNCMAWRWGPSYKWNEDEDKPEVTYSTTHGYCGMVKS